MNDKKTLISIIVLLVLCLPMAVYGVYMHKNEKEIIIDDNPNRDFILNNKIYFYVNDVLTATRDCEAQCSIVEPQIDDTQYDTHYYSFGEEKLPNVLDNGYALFQENNKTVLYNIALQSILLQFDNVKTYNVEHTKPILIVKSNSLYGVISLDDMSPVLSYQYDYIAIPNRVNNGILDTSKFIVKSGPEWLIVDNEGNKKIESVREQIVDFNNTYVVTNNSGVYKVFDYNNNQYLTGMNLKSIYCVGEYVLVIDRNNTLELYSDLNSLSIKSVPLPTYKTIEFDLVENQINVYIDGTNSQSIVLV